ncbi:MAG: Biopolymer transport protein ExbD/TolR [Myxococcales bacterium]|nr:Biopolymer transport protein ExbD/TolR [Myxococcales bacterium]
MELSAQRVRSKTRNAVRRREDLIEQEEIESGELNLIPYLDMVTNLMLFLLASVSAGLILTQIDTTLPDKKPDGPPVAASATPNPDDQPLKMVVSVTRDRAILWSVSGLEGTLQQPKLTFPRTGQDGQQCDGNYMCESNVCEPNSQKCVAGKEVPQPVFDYRAISAALKEIANRRYAGKFRKAETYQAILMADGGMPYSTIVSVMAAMRCKMPDFAKEAQPCLLPSEDPDLKKAPNPIGEKYYDTARAQYNPDKMALFHDILFSSGFE